jgi:hypothetical protein
VSDENVVIVAAPAPNSVIVQQPGPSVVMVGPGNFDFAGSAAGVLLTSMQKAANGNDVANPGSFRANTHVPVLASCQAVATTNLTLSGTQTVDGYTAVVGDQILAAAQTTGSQNGPWIVAAGAWVRPTDYASGAVVKGRQIQVNAGILGGGSLWVMQTTTSVTVDTTATTWQIGNRTQNDARYLALGGGRASGLITFGASQQIGDTATYTSAPVLTNSRGTRGGRLQLQTSTNAGGTSSAELILIPDTNNNPATGIATELLMMNVSGTNYERAGLVWVGNTFGLFVNYNGAGLPRVFNLQMGGSVGLGIANQSAILVHGDASVDLLGSTYTVTNGIVPAATTVSSVVAGTSWTMSAPAAVTGDWPSGATAVQSVTVNGRVVPGCTFTAGSAVVLGNSLVGDATHAISSTNVFGSLTTRIADSADTGISTLIIDTHTTTPSNSTPTDKSRIQFNRVTRKWLAGNNVGGANGDTFDIANNGGIVYFQLSQNGNIRLGLGANAVSLVPSGVGVLGIGDATTTPTTPPTAGGNLYSFGGALYWYGSSGTRTLVAAA